MDGTGNAIGIPRKVKNKKERPGESVKWTVRGKNQFGRTNSHRIQDKR